MRIVILAASNSIHTVRWVNSLSEAGVDIHLVSQHGRSNSVSESVKQHVLPYSGGKGYFLNVFALKRLLSEIQPDILHSHYATGYGTLGRLANYKPYLLSVWGSDVYDSPDESKIMRYLVVENLKSATAIASTSLCMAKKTNELFDFETKPIYITPFGVDTELFSSRITYSNQSAFTIGTVKTIEDKYGIDTLIRGFALFMQYAEKPIKDYQLKIVGEGSKFNEMVGLVAELNIKSNVIFVGRVEHHKVPQELNSFDVYAALSRLDSESFGVAVVEASACELPVIVSNVGGLPEVVEHGKTGYIINKNSPEDFAKALFKLVSESDLCRELGVNGRNRVVEYYSWDESVRKMLNLYSDLARE